MRTIAALAFPEGHKREAKASTGPLWMWICWRRFYSWQRTARLPERLRDHSLTGEWADHRDCHIKPDLVLIYRVPDADTFQLVRIGSHSSWACRFSPLPRYTFTCKLGHSARRRCLNARTPSLKSSADRCEASFRWRPQFSHRAAVWRAGEQTLHSLHRLRAIQQQGLRQRNARRPTGRSVPRSASPAPFAAPLVPSVSCPRAVTHASATPPPAAKGTRQQSPAQSPRALRYTQTWLRRRPA